MSSQDIIKNFEKVKNNISKFCKQWKRNESEVNIVVVCKKQSVKKIAPLLESGHRIFAENRIKEALEKWPDLKEQYKNTELHLIGTLQTNKAKKAIELFDVIHTVDRKEIADKLMREMKAADKYPECFVQINTGKEPQKSGIVPYEADNFINHCKKIGLPVKGLMCIPPIDEPAALHFAMLRKIAKRNELPYLSMGMSGDYEYAISVGATHIRPGTAIFGKRR